MEKLKCGIVANDIGLIASIHKMLQSVVNINCREFKSKWTKIKLQFWYWIMKYRRGESGVTCKWKMTGRD